MKNQEQISDAFLGVRLNIFLNYILNKQYGKKHIVNKTENLVSCISNACVPRYEQKQVDKRKDVYILTQCPTSVNPKLKIHTKSALVFCSTCF